MLFHVNPPLLKVGRLLGETQAVKWVVGLALTNFLPVVALFVSASEPTIQIIIARTGEFDLAPVSVRVMESCLVLIAAGDKAD